MEAVLEDDRSECLDMCSRLGRNAVVAPVSVHLSCSITRSLRHLPWSALPTFQQNVM